MRQTPQVIVELGAVVDCARVVLLVDGAVTEGFRGVAVAQDDGQLVVHFRWRNLPYPLQVRIALDDGLDPLTRVPSDSAEDWVHGLVFRLMEELDTGAVAWCARQIRGEGWELLLDEPRVDAVPRGFLDTYFVEQRPSSRWSLMGPGGLDIAVIRELDLARTAATWWVAYVNNNHGAPDVAQLLVVRDGPDLARLHYLQVRHDLPDSVPDSVVAQMVYMAVFEAACNGARTIASGLAHPAQRHVGGLVEQQDGILTWRYDGPFLEPPVLTRPVRPRATYPRA